ncbi:hypothetical protein HAX54_039113 [Datura stramonium]|uniref:GAT domain-containing protein n=1 Tax=Datura stramonium TaxID=4076 RepID=A0ABS8VM23_DATST|nr:hypothetical protein [Datura stramonium]
MHWHSSKDDLAVSMLENCKQSLTVIQRIKSTSGDEGLMFEALNLHDELRQVISTYEEMEAALDSGERLPCTPENGSGPAQYSLGELRKTA